MPLLCIAMLIFYPSICLLIKVRVKHMYVHPLYIYECIVHGTNNKASESISVIKF